MKKYFLTTLILSFLAIYSVSAQETEKIKWYSFEDAIKLNKENPKKIFIDVYTDWCGWCKVLDRETFSNSVIIKIMNENYYAVKLDAERKDTVVFNGYTFVNPNPSVKRSPHQLASSLLQGKMSYPSMVFLDEKTQLITTVQSFLKPTELEPIIAYIAQNKYLTIGYDSFKTAYKSEAVNNIDLTPKPVILNKVIFNDGQTTLKDSSYFQLDSIVKAMITNPKIKIEINAYIDNTGDKEKNTTISTQRAKIIYDYFIDKKIEAVRITYNGKGYSPTYTTIIDKKKTSQRVEIKIVE